MDGLLKWGLIAAGAFVGWEWLKGQGAAGAVVSELPGAVTVASVSTGPNGVSDSLMPSPCAYGYQLDAGGICTRYADTQLLANLNSIQWTGSADLPTEQINRIDPAILSQYSSETNVVPGTVLAYMLGLGGPAPAGTFLTGSDGNKYQMAGGVWVRQTAGLSGVGRIPPNFQYRRPRVTTTTIRRPGVAALSRLQAAIPTARLSGVVQRGW